MIVSATQYAGTMRNSAAHRVRHRRAGDGSPLKRANANGR